MATRPIPDWLDADRAAFMQSNVSMSLGSRNGDLRPSVARGLGCRILPGGEVHVFVNGAQSQELLDDVRACGQVAVVFSDIVSHRTMQVKAIDARTQALDADDQAAAEAYAPRFGGSVVALGYPAPVPQNLLRSEPGERVVIAFHAHEGFEQTPGPQAGQRLEPAR